MINARLTLLQSKLTTRYLELVHSIYTEPVDEKLMGELIFNFVMTLPPLSCGPTIPMEKRKRKKKSASNEEAGNGNRDIRAMFSAGKKKKKQQENCIIIE